MSQDEQPVRRISHRGAEGHHMARWSALGPVSSDVVIITGVIREESTRPKDQRGVMKPASASVGTADAQVRKPQIY